MKRVFSYIVKGRLVLKGPQKALPIVLPFLLICNACKPPESLIHQIAKLPPQAQERLARLPYFGDFLVPKVAPRNLLAEAQKAVEKARLAGAPYYAREQFQKACEYLHLGEDYYQKKRFIWARDYLQKSIQNAQEAYQTAKELRQKAQKACQQKLLTLQKALLSEKKLSTDEQFFWSLKIKELTLLIEEERFQEFNQQWHHLWQELKQKRGPLPPSKSQKLAD